MGLFTKIKEFFMPYSKPEPAPVVEVTAPPVAPTPPEAVVETRPIEVVPAVQEPLVVTIEAAAPVDQVTFAPGLTTADVVTMENQITFSLQDTLSTSIQSDVITVNEPYTIELALVDQPETITTFTLNDTWPFGTPEEKPAKVRKPRKPRAKKVETPEPAPAPAPAPVVEPVPLIDISLHLPARTEDKPVPRIRKSRSKKST